MDRPAKAPFFSDFWAERKAYLAAIVVSFGGMAFGYDTGVAGGVVVLPSFLHSMTGSATMSPSAKANLSSNVVSVLFLGAFVGSFFGVPSVHYVGPRKTLALAALVFIAGAIVQIARDDSLACIYTGRVFAGVGIGMISNVSNAYIAETSPARIRGKTASLFQFALVIGGMIAYFTTYGVSKYLEPVPSSIQWRIAFGMQIPPAIFMLVGLPFIKESPRWLALKGRSEQALEALAYFRAKSTEDEAVRLELDQIQRQIEEERQATNGVTWKECLLPGNRNRFLAAYSVVFFLIFTGHNSILYYGPTIFASIGYATNAGLLASGLFGVIKVGCTPIFIIFLVDRFGRKTLLQFGNIFKAAILFTFAGLTSTALVKGSARGNAAAAMLYLYIVAYSWSYGPLIWILISEYFPTRLRQYGISSAVALTWLLNYAISKITPIALNNIKWKFWIIIACLNLVALAGTYFLPESRGRSLEEMDFAFGVKPASDVERGSQKPGPEYTNSDATPEDEDLSKVKEAGDALVAVQPVLSRAV